MKPSRSTQRKTLYFALTFSLIAACGRGQLFELSGGTSTLYQAQGGTLQVHGPSYNAMLGAGIVAGRFVGGAKLEKSYKGRLYALGSQTIGCDLPTDLFDPGHFLYTMGASVKTKMGAMSVFAFGGTTSKDYGSPFFDGARMQKPAAMLLVKRPLGELATVSSEVILSTSTTAIASLEWKPQERWTAAISAGVGASQPYMAFSLAGTKQWMDLKAEYVSAGNKFRRVSDDSLLSPEPDGANVQFTLRPAKGWSVSAGRQNYLVQQPGIGANERSTVENASLNAQVKNATFSATLFQSEYLGRTSLSEIFSASDQVTEKIRVAGTYFENQSPYGEATSQLMVNVEETLTARWTVNEVLNTSSGQMTAGVGGAFHSNVLEVSADYETYYVPTRVENPFERALIVNALLTLPGGVGVHGETFVAPDGRLLYTADVRGFLSRGMAEKPTVKASPMGGMLLRGKVVDVHGQPVMGAALMINQAQVFADSNGCFAIRERKPREHLLTVMVNDFMDGGKWRVVSAPNSVRSEAGENALEVIIVVARL